MTLTRSLLACVAACALMTAAPAFAQMKSGVDLTSIDKSIKPGDDFWTYANNTWVKAHPIPADRSRYGKTAVMVEEASKRTVDLIQDAAKGGTGDGKKVGDYYASYMDEAAIEAKGLAPLKTDLARIAAIKDKKQLATVLGGNIRADVDALNSTDFYTDNVLGLWVSPAFDDTSQYAPFLLQGGLGMPDREYYLSDKASMVEARTKYVAHVEKILTLGGVADPAAKAKAIMALETQLAQASASRADSADVQKANNSWTAADFASKAPGLDWAAFFAAAKLSGQPRFIVWHPTMVTGLGKAAAEVPLATWKDYLTFHLLDHYSNVLPKAFVDERFAFYNASLQGVPALSPRWKRAVNSTNAVLGEAVGKLYADKYFSAESKAAVTAMVDSMKVAFEKRIDALAWMDPATKAEARKKVSVLKVGVGYPDTWRDYSAYAVVRGDAFGNLQRSEAFDYATALAKLGKPVDRGEWVMTPQTVNAVNLPMLNALNFPAAILAPPNFDLANDPAANYGATGATIGHEISHSFDDQGAQFDSQGRLRNWWTPADLAQFEKAGTALAEQFDTYKPFPDLAVNGKQTLSENIADVAGLGAALDAYHASLGGKPAPVIDGMTGDQRFFLAFAQSWLGYSRPAALRQQIITDGHAPDQYRAFTVRNLDDWYAAFDIKPGDSMYLPPEKRVKVW
ncbi:M13 family metallopeptidase [Caulobacter sp. RL271]|jgi:predicted metalloendopeptidase|uniref:M13 family metallopeptidase n=1 Tax=Caulobacter segnis TaxID=88688 RepID=A0ABY4ZPC0_9CAUL|nr:M13 family metallopeptidase [Caulobacter segnis]USQ94049.1 M13 family metallopeptidase [Caulobacter segnis]